MGPRREVDFSLIWDRKIFMYANEIKDSIAEANTEDYCQDAAAAKGYKVKKKWTRVHLV